MGAGRRRLRGFVGVSACVVMAAGLALLAPAMAGASVPAANGLCQATTSCPIRHVVIIVKENHSFDNLFARFPGADAATFAKENGVAVPLTTEPDRVPNIAHTRDASLLAIDGGAMDGFYKIPHDPPAGTDNADGAYTEAQIPAYWSYAK